MVASWELQEQNQVLLGFLHTETTSVAWALGLRNLIVPGPLMPVAGMPFDMARNEICQTALAIGARFCMMLDSDVIPPRDAILRLMRHNLPIVSGVYHRRSPPHGVPVMMRPVGQWVTQYPANALIEVDVVGAGCLLIRRDVLEKFAKEPQRPGLPWFDWRVNMRDSMPREDCLSEDFTFCVHARKKFGIKTMVDTSVQCRHCGMAQATYGAMSPLECTPIT